MKLKNLVRAFKNFFVLTKKVLTTKKIITAETDPELIAAVTTELQQYNASIILGKLQDLEKALYHLASRQKDAIDRQASMDQHIIATSSNVEEILHGIENAMEESDESEAWENKKETNLLN